MSELVGQGSKYTDDQRREAAVQYAIEGSLRSVERSLNIPNQTLNDWRKSEWWDSIVVQVRAENQDKHIARYHELTSESLDLALEGIRELDGKSLKAGDIKALVVTGATATDKARLLMNQPTSISAKAEGMTELAAQFKALSQQWEEKQANVVATQDTESST